MNAVNIGNIGYKGDMLKKWKIGIQGIYGIYEMQGNNEYRELG